MRGSNKEYCLNCNEQTAIGKRHGVLRDYTDINMGFFIEDDGLSDVEKFDKKTLCEECYDLEHG